MAIEDRRRRDRAARRELITAAARSLAEQEGWDAVTTRRLSAEIEYSQPVIYQHFTSMEDLVEAVAVDGFGELAEALAAALSQATSDDMLGAAARAYTAFAARNPALYEAMFTRATRLHFGLDAVAELRNAFGELRTATATVAGTRDVDTLTEVVWASLHGLTSLGQHDRLRPEHAIERIEMLVASFLPASKSPSRRPRGGRR